MAEAKVAFLTGLPQKLVDVITQHCPEGFHTVLVPRDAPEEEQVAAVRDADFLMVYRATPSERLLHSARKLRLVQILSAGYDNMPLKLLRELEIPCANNGGANSWAVADHAVLLMLALYKRLLHADRATREGRWNEPITGDNTFEMAGKLVGIVGLGNIGRQVARRVQGFDARVQYYDKFPLDPEHERQLGVSRVDLDTLFQTSDIVTLHTPLTAETRGLVDRRRLWMMKPTAILVNTCRGGVVDEEALIEALREGRIAGAGINVFQQEPVNPDNPLLKMDNVIVTPHMAGTTWDTWFRRARFAYDNMQRVWRGEPPLAVVREYE